MTDLDASRRNTVAKVVDKMTVEEAVRILDAPLDFWDLEQHALMQQAEAVLREAEKERSRG